MSKPFIVYLLLLLSVFNSQAQERALGTWKTFMPYGNSLGVFDADDRVYSIASKTVFSYEKNTGTIQIYDKANGLSDIGIKTANYDPATKVLAIAYNNSNLDFIYSGTDIYNIPDIKNKNSVSAVSVNSISFYNGNAYVSSDIGISVIDLTRKEISNTYIIGTTGEQVKVYATAVDGAGIYAATEQGVKRASFTSVNLQDYNNWVVYDTAQHLPKKKATWVACYNQKVYAVVGSNNCDSLFELSGQTWSNIYFDNNHTFTSLYPVNGNLYFTTWNNVVSDGKFGKIDAANNLTTTNTAHARPIAWLESSGVTWLGDLWGGLYKSVSGNEERIAPDGPGSASVYDIDVANSTVNIAPGGVDDAWGFAWNFDGFFQYNNHHWNNTNQFNYPPLNAYSDILCSATSTTTGKTYFGSFLSGLIELDGSGNIQLYNKGNSILEGAMGDTQRTKISALAADREGNIWIGNANAPKPFKMIPANGGAWKSYSVPYFIEAVKKIVIDQYGQLWAPVRRSGEGILVWNNNGTPDDPSDDVSRILGSGTGNGGLPEARVYSIVEDKEGNIWAGTAQGIGVFYCPGSVLTSNGCDADQIKVERDGYVGYLFGTESVRALAVDAANRKWVGTTNGLWLISDDGKTELLKFNVDNSPLPSNQITDIAIDDQTGEVFIGTLNGLVSYQGDAIGECTDCNEALVYPNPVKPDYSGPIAIKGLTENAYVKITDVSGTLIFQGRANGSQMIWNGKGYNGNRAKSGVYLVFSSTDLGKERKVGKILIAN